MRYYLSNKDADLTKFIKLVDSRIYGHSYGDIEQNISDESKLYKLYYWAKTNGLLLTYLDATKEYCNRRSMRSLHCMIYKYYRGKLNKFVSSLRKISKVLEKGEFKYAIFKTLLVFPELASDVDVVIDDSVEIEDLISYLQNHGYSVFKGWPHCIAVIDNENHVRIDIYSEISIEYLIYLNKRKLIKYAVETLIDKDVVIKSFSKEADLIALIAQASICEYAFTLRDYYVVSQYLKAATMADINTLINIIKDNYLTKAAQWYFSIYIVLYLLTYNAIPLKLRYLISHLGGLNSRVKHMRQIQLPFFEDPITLIGIFSEKLKETSFKRSFSEQLIKIHTFRERLRRIVHRSLKALTNLSIM